MGADIHSVAQVDWIQGKGAWEDVTDALWRYPYFNDERPVSFHNVPYHNQPLYGRNYWAFGALAGVRVNDLPLIHPLRGIPDGFTKYGNDDWPADSLDLHSHSWVTFEELDEYADKTNQNVVRNYFRDALTPLRDLHDRGLPIRFVYAFDN